MSGDKITRRGFLSWALAGASFLVLSIIGCGKKEEKKPSEEAKPSTPEMTEEQKQEYVFTNCICKRCPSYVECEEKAGFCLVGKSTCIKEKKGCTDGSAMELMEKEKAEHT
jgi:hypothetical protein